MTIKIRLIFFLNRTSREKFYPLGQVIDLEGEGYRAVVASVGGLIVNG
jgi:hypothetical protein